MKIYFEDGEMAFSYLPFAHTACRIDAKYGYSKNSADLDFLSCYQPDTIVYTNSLLALDNKYCWNKELKVPELYIRAGEHMVFTRVDKLTTRELRQGHNLMKLYMNGEFGN